MTGYKNKTAAFIFIAAVLLLTGCAMKRDVIRVEERVMEIRSGQRETQRSIDRIDSLLTGSSDETVKLRAEVRSTINSLLEELQMMRANINDLQDKVGYLATSDQKRVIVMPPTSAGDTAGATTEEPAPPGIDCQELYDESFIEIRRGQYENAIKGFTDYLQYCGTKDLADNARFWIGEAYYSMEKYPEAIREFRQLEIDFSTSEKRPGALYKMARSYEELGELNDAKAIFEKLVENYPGTLESEQAREKLKELK